MTYAQAVAELETILAQLQEVPADIDQLNARVARARELVEAIDATLRTAEDGLAKLDQRTNA